MNMQIFKAGNGDSILVQFTDRLGLRRNILVDGGNVRSSFSENLYKYLVENIVASERVDLLVVTHLDQDHIKGVLYLLDALNAHGSKLTSLHVNEVWFNSRKTLSLQPNHDISSGDMLQLELSLESMDGIIWCKRITCGYEVKLFGATITVLSPNVATLEKYVNKYRDSTLDVAAEGSDYSSSIEALFEVEKKHLELGSECLDDKLENAVSIAFLIEHNDKSALLLGDAIPSVIDTSIELLLRSRGLAQLDVDAIKISHHGSRKSVSMKFLEMVRSRNYIISTNGKKSNLPNKSTIAKILLHPKRDVTQIINIFFNYSEVIDSLNISHAEYYKYNFQCIPPNQEYGSSITL